jgi:hypothetical protein
LSIGTSNIFHCSASVTLTFPHGDVFTDTFAYEYVFDNSGKN